MGAGPSSSGLQAAGPVVTLSEIADHCMDQEWVESAWLQAGLRLADAPRTRPHAQLLGDLAFSKGEEERRGKRRKFAFS